MVLSRLGGNLCGVIFRRGEGGGVVEMILWLRLAQHKKKEKTNRFEAGFDRSKRVCDTR
jgi:hypothetical protein